MKRTKRVTQLAASVHKNEIALHQAAISLLLEEIPDAGSSIQAKAAWVGELLLALCHLQRDFAGDDLKTKISDGLRHVTATMTISQVIFAITNIIKLKGMKRILFIMDLMLEFLFWSSKKRTIQEAERAFIDKTT